MSAGTWELQGTLGYHSKTLCGERARGERGYGGEKYRSERVKSGKWNMENTKLFHHVGRNGILFS